MIGSDSTRDLLRLPRATAGDPGRTGVSGGESQRNWQPLACQRTSPGASQPVDRCMNRMRVIHRRDQVRVGYCLFSEYSRGDRGVDRPVEAVDRPDIAVSSQPRNRHRVPHCPPVSGVRCPVSGVRCPVFRGAGVAGSEESRVIRMART